MNNDLLKFLGMVLGIIIPLILINIQYKTEIKKRTIWIKKRLKGSRIKYLISIAILMQISMSISQLVFGNFTKYSSAFFGTLTWSTYSIMLFLVFFYKHLYEFLGGKRKWKKKIKEL